MIRELKNIYLPILLFIVTIGCGLKNSDAVESVNGSYFDEDASCNLAYSAIVSIVDNSDGAKEYDHEPYLSKSLKTHCCRVLDCEHSGGYPKTNDDNNLKAALNRLDTALMDYAYHSKENRAKVLLSCKHDILNLGTFISDQLTSVIFDIIDDELTSDKPINALNIVTKISSFNSEMLEIIFQESKNLNTNTWYLASNDLLKMLSKEEKLNYLSHISESYDKIFLDLVSNYPKRKNELKQLFSIYANAFGNLEKNFVTQDSKDSKSYKNINPKKNIECIDKVFTHLESNDSVLYSLIYPEKDQIQAIFDSYSDFEKAELSKGIYIAPDADGKYMFMKIVKHKPANSDFGDDDFWTIESKFEGKWYKEGDPMFFF